MSTVGIAPPAPIMVWVGKERTATTAAAGGGAPAPALKATRYTRLMPSLSADTLVDELAQRAAALLFPGVSSTDIDLYLVPHEGERKPPAEAEAGAAQPGACARRRCTAALGCAPPHRGEGEAGRGSP